ncbi:MAG: hypothetical protein R6U89_07820 [Dehalococcoidia bacterium]
MLGHNRLAGHYRRQKLEAEEALRGRTPELKATPEKENKVNRIQVIDSSEEKDGFVIMDHNSVSERGTGKPKSIQ